jgi:hypothetical protein
MLFAGVHKIDACHSEHGFYEFLTQAVLVGVDELCYCGGGSGLLHGGILEKWVQIVGLHPFRERKA